MSKSLQNLDLQKLKNVRKLINIDNNYKNKILNHFSK